MLRRLLLLLLPLGLLCSAKPKTSSKDPHAQYEKAMGHYAAKKYEAAAKLLEEVAPLLKGQKEEAAARFHKAYCAFYQKNYQQSAEQFRQFRATFPRDPHTEEAFYMQGYALYLDTLDAKLDQTRTIKVLALFNDYLQIYPEGGHRDKAQNHVYVLQDRLAHKALLIARLYYQLEHYQATVIACQHFQADFPGAPGSEEIAYLKVAAQYQGIRDKAADQTITSKALQAFTQYYSAFVDQYPESKYLVTVRKYHKAMLSIGKPS